MVVVQAEGCAPIVRAFERGERYAELWPNAQTRAAGMRVPAAIGDYLILDAVRESGGTALTVSEEEILDGAARAGPRWRASTRRPKAPPPWPRAAPAAQRGLLAGDERVVLFNTGMGLKYPPPA